MSVIHTDNGRPTFAGLYVMAREHILARLSSWRVPAGEIEDVIHDTVLIAHRKLDRFEVPAGVDPERALKSWLRGIAWRLATKRWKRSELPTAKADEETALDPDPEEQASAAERRRILGRILRALRHERAHVLILHASGGLSVREIARALGVNENTVKSRLHRAIVDARVAAKRLKPSEVLLLLDGEDQRGAP